jgi:hypothetical protein
MVNSTAYSILVFYGVLAIVCAALGNYFDKKNGFSYGYVGGTLLSLVLWFSAGRKMAGV